MSVGLKGWKPLPKPVREARTPKPLRRGPRRGRSRVPEALRRHRKLEQLADKLWSLLVRASAAVCVRCKARPVAQADHLVSRRYQSVRWVLSNGAPLCAGCHRLVTSDTYEHVRLAVQHVGADRWEQLNTAKHCGKVDPAAAIVYLRYEVEERGLTALARERGLL